jgi:hypothetical protein
MQAKYRGFLTPRVLAVLIVLVLLLIVPLYLSKNRGALQTQKPVVQTTPVAASTTEPRPPMAVANPDRLGLSLGHGSVPDHPHLILSTCSGEPSPSSQTGKTACDTTQGDTSCRTALPLLCIRKDGGSAESQGLSPELQAAWIGGTLAATAPVAGFVLASQSDANARCTNELGEGWRMADMRDASPAGSLLGRRGNGLFSVHTRHWVAAAPDQKANCWDPT